MKSKTDPRHQKRVQIMKGLFSQSFDQGIDPQTPANIQPIIHKLAQIDQLIIQCAPEWPLEQINRVDLAILRLSLFELINDNTPFKVIIDEAVELAKEYGSENSAKFVNGVLGSALEKIS